MTMAAWRVANSLNVLLNQLNALAPARSKVSDGSIGDPAHSSRVSDHNPDPAGIVRARDFTHDPVHMSGGWLADKLISNRDPRIKYIIWNRQIWQPSTGWRPYDGANPHTSHLHLSVVADGRADSTAPWAGFTPTQEDDMQADERNWLKAIFDGIYVGGPSTHGEALANTAWATKADVIAIRAGVGQLTDDEANILAAVSGAKGELLTALASIDGTPSDEQVADLADKLNAQLGGAYSVTITPVAPTE